MLLLGGLFGYAIGNAMGSSWAIPLAIAGAASGLAAMFRAPVAAAALILEVGHDGQMWWLASLAVLSSSLLARVVQAKPLHERILDRMGLRLVGGRAASVLASLRTADAMFDNIATITEGAGITEMRDAAASSRHNFLGVLTSDGKYVGLLPLEQLPARVKQALRPDANPSYLTSIERVVEIRDLIDSLAPTVLPGDSLESALVLLEDAPCVPVVDNDRKLRGFLFDSAVAAVYKREISGTVIRGALIKN
jgi:CBS domain-containing protein